VHFHLVAIDGVYVADGEGVRFVGTPAPTTAEVEEVVGNIAVSAERFLAQKGFGSRRRWRSTGKSRCCCSSRRQ
jgi:hypothetical protein